MTERRADPSADAEREDDFEAEIRILQTSAAASRTASSETEPQEAPGAGDPALSESEDEAMRRFEDFMYAQALIGWTALFGGGRRPKAEPRGAAAEATEDLAPPRRPDPAPPPPAPAPRDPLRAELEPHLGLLAALEADPELCAEWLRPAAESEGARLARLIAQASQWERATELWDLLAARCKRERRPAAPGERAILSGCLAVHNLIWRGREAALASASAGGAFDYERHERGTPQGERVAAEWLPGLTNAGGRLIKKTLVATV